MSSCAFAKLHPHDNDDSESRCRPIIDLQVYLLFLNRNSTMLLKLFIFSNLFVAFILHDCSLHRNDQYGLVLCLLGNY